MKDFSLLKMEDIFLITFSVATAIGVILAVLVHLIFEHDNKENDDG